MKIAYDDARCYQNLIYAVIARAIMDACLVSKSKYLDKDVRSAFDFLLGDDVDIWLELIDIDPGQFKKKIKDSMFSDQCKIADHDKRSFRINYKKWYQQTYAPKLMSLGYKTWAK